MLSKTIDYSNPKSLGSSLRARRLRAFWPLVVAASAKSSPVTILDIGGTRDYWRILPPDAALSVKLSITLVNLSSEGDPLNDPTFRSVVADGCNLSIFSDGAFDIVHSNSVLEHVGDWARMTAFAGEVRRLAPAYFVQTPNFWFPIEPHYMRPFVHWIPEPVRARLLTTMGIGQYPRAASMDEAMRFVQGNRLLSRNMLKSLFPDSTIRTERFGLLPKSLMAIRSAE